MGTSPSGPSPDPSPEVPPTSSDPSTDTSRTRSLRRSSSAARPTAAQSSPRVDPGTITDRQEFAAALTRVREHAGLTVRDLARTVGQQPSTLGGYFSGRHLPPVTATAQLAELLSACGVPEGELPGWREALVRVRHTPVRPVEDASPSQVSPYRGLECFGPEDAERFFGREDLTAALVREVRHAAAGSGVVVVVGASGSGKSSLLRAGLIPAVQRGELNCPEHPRNWRLITPGSDPVTELEEALAGSSGCRLVIIDQFEEVFTDCHDEQRRRTLVARLLQECGAGSDTVAVLGLRADFYAQTTRIADLVEVLQRHQIVVGPMDEAGLRRTIEEPAHRAGLALEEGLVEVLLQAVAPLAPVGPEGAHEPGALPLLSHALLAAWQRSSRGRLTVADYQAAGEVRGAVATTAEEIYAGLGPGEQEAARQLFRRLVSPGPEVTDARRRVRHSELATDGDHPNAELGAVIEAYVRGRLLTADDESVQISHEALLLAWPRLREWLDADRAGLQLQHRLSEAAARWRAGGRGPHLLYRAGRLQAAREWAADPGHRAGLTPVEREFLDEAEALADREERNRRAAVHRLRRLVAGLLVLLLTSGALAGYAFRLRAVAADERDLALSRQLAVESTRLRAQDPALAAQLAVAAYRIARTPQARAGLLDAAAVPVPTRLIGPPGELQAAVTDRAGRLVAGAGEHGTVRLWSMPDTGTPEVLTDLPVGDGSSVFALALTPDGRTLAAAGADHRVHLWDLGDPRHPVAAPPLTGPGNTVYALAFDPEGTKLAAGSADGTVRLWNVTGPAVATPVPRPLTGPHGTVQSVAFSPDGQDIAAAGEDGLIRRWNLTEPARPKPLTTLHGPSGLVHSVAYCPDGHRIAAGTRDGHVHLWDLTTARPASRRRPAVPPHRTVLPLGEGGWLNAVAFSPDGTMLAAGGSDSRLWLWNLRTDTRLASLPHPGPVTAVSFRSGDSLLTAAADGTARFWPVTGPRATGLSDKTIAVGFDRTGEVLAAGARGQAGLWQIEPDGTPRPAGGPLTATGLGDDVLSGAAALSPNGTLLAEGTRAGKVVVWDVSDPDHPVQRSDPLAVADDLVEWMEFSPDGRRLAVGGDDGAVRLLDLADPAHPVAGAVLDQADNFVLGLTFSPDGRWLAAGTANRTVWLWDVSDPAHPKALGPPLRGPDSYVHGMEFSPDGGALAVGGADHRVWLWNVSDPGRPTRLGDPLTGPSDYVLDVTFSPDGRTLAAGVMDGTVWLWDVRNRTHPGHLGTLTGPGGAANAVTFSPDGALLAAGSNDHRVWLWRTDPQAATAAICAHVGDGITPQEWAEHAAGARYRPACPSGG